GRLHRQHGERGPARSPPGHAVHRRRDGPQEGRSFCGYQEDDHRLPGDHDAHRPKPVCAVKFQPGMTRPQKRSGQLPPVGSHGANAMSSTLRAVGTSERRSTAILLALVAAAGAGLGWADDKPKTTLKAESFDRDPGWEGHNNRVEPTRVPTVKQDFG